MNSFKWYTEFMIISICLIITAFTELVLVPVFVKYNIPFKTVAIGSMVVVIILRICAGLIIKYKRYFCLLWPFCGDVESEEDEPYNHLVS